MGNFTQTVNSNMNSQIPYITHPLQSNPFPSNNFYYDYWNNYYPGQANSSHLDISSIKEEMNKK